MAAPEEQGDPLRAQVYARRKEIADLYGGFSSGALSHGQFLAGMKALGLPLGPSFYFATRSGRADFSLHTLFKSILVPNLDMELPSAAGSASVARTAHGKAHVPPPTPGQGDAVPQRHSARRRSALYDHQSVAPEPRAPLSDVPCEDPRIHLRNCLYDFADSRITLPQLEERLAGLGLRVTAAQMQLLLRHQRGDSVPFRDMYLAFSEPEFYGPLPRPEEEAAGTPSAKMRSREAYMEQRRPVSQRPEHQLTDTINQRAATPTAQPERYRPGRKFFDEQNGRLRASDAVRVNIQPDLNPVERVPAPPPRPISQVPLGASQAEPVPHRKTSITLVPDRVGSPTSLSGQVFPPFAQDIPSDEPVEPKAVTSPRHAAESAPVAAVAPHDAYEDARSLSARPAPLETDEESLFYGRADSAPPARAETAAPAPPLDQGMPKSETPSQAAAAAAGVPNVDELRQLYGRPVTPSLALEGQPCMFERVREARAEQKAGSWFAAVTAASLAVLQRRLASGQMAFLFDQSSVSYRRVFKLDPNSNELFVFHPQGSLVRVMTFSEQRRREHDEKQQEYNKFSATFRERSPFATEFTASASSESLDKPSGRRRPSSHTLPARINPTLMPSDTSKFY